MDANGGEPDIDRTDTDREIHDNSFLIDEGFELLADFKSIDDVAMRRTIRTLVAAIAKRHATNVVAFPPVVNAPSSPRNVAIARDAA